MRWSAWRAGTSRAWWRSPADTPRRGPECASFWGNHPVPGPSSLAAGRSLLREVRSADPADRLLFLISGGGSAVVEVPVPRVTLTDIARTTELLLGSGARIQAMNAVRRHVSAIKGGHLAPPGGAGSFATLAISDVVGDSPENIASGPTVPDPTTFRVALRVVDRTPYGPASPLE